MLLSIPEVGNRLMVSRDSVYRLINSGRLRVVDVGTGDRPRLRIREDDLHAFIDANTHDTPTESLAEVLNRRAHSN